MAFDGVLPPESASFARQAGISRPLECQSTPERLLHRFPSQGPQVPPPVGKPEWPPRSAVLGSPCGESDLRAGGKGCPDPFPPLPSSVARQRRKKGRSHHQHPSRAARRRAVRGGDSGAGAAPRSAGEPAYPSRVEGRRAGLRSRESLLPAAFATCRCLNLVPRCVSSPPLIKPDVRFSRIRLSVKIMPSPSEGSVASTPGK